MSAEDWVKRLVEVRTIEVAMERKRTHFLKTLETEMPGSRRVFIRQLVRMANDYRLALGELRIQTKKCIQAAQGHLEKEHRDQKGDQSPVEHRGLLSVEKLIDGAVTCVCEIATCLLKILNSPDETFSNDEHWDYAAEQLSLWRNLLIRITKRVPCEIDCNVQELGDLMVY